MKSIIVIISLLLSLTSIAQTKTEVITFTDIHVEDIGNPSAFIAYNDSRGNWHADMRFEDNEVFVNGVILFGYDGDILTYFNDEYAQELIGKKIVMTFQEKNIKYFGVVPYVISLKLK